MAIYKTTSSQVIIRKVMRDLAPEDPNWIHDAVEWIGEALEHIGASAQLEKKTCLVKIEDHKGALPNDMYYLEQVALNDDQQTEAQLQTTIDRINQHIRDISDKVSESDDLRAGQFAGYNEDLNIYNPSLAALVQDTNGRFSALDRLGNEQRSLIRRLMADAHVVYSNHKHDRHAYADYGNMHWVICTVR